MIHGIIYICPECKGTWMENVGDNTVIQAQRLLCVNDGYMMRPFVLNDLLVDSMLKGETNAPM